MPTLSQGMVRRAFNTILFPLVVSTLIIYFRYGSRNYYFSLATLLLITCLLFFYWYEKVFREKQIEWLKVNGVVKPAKIKKVSLNFSRGFNTKRLIYAEANSGSITNTYVSEVVYFNTFNPFKARTVDTAKVMSLSGGNTNVRISPQNSKVYWVDTDFLK